jgi:hypothetical protein
MNNLERRLAALESEQSPARGYIVLQGAGETSEQAKALAGISPSGDDMVILVCRQRQIAATEKRCVSEFAVQS